MYQYSVAENILPQHLTQTVTQPRPLRLSCSNWSYISHSTPQPLYNSYKTSQPFFPWLPIPHAIFPTCFPQSPVSAYQSPWLNPLTQSPWLNPLTQSPWLNPLDSIPSAKQTNNMCKNCLFSPMVLYIKPHPYPIEQDSGLHNNASPRRLNWSYLTSPPIYESQTQ